MKINPAMSQLIASSFQEISFEIPDNCVDLIVTSPPYNVKLGQGNNNSKKYDSHDDDMPEIDYYHMLTDSFIECRRILKSGGRIAINIGNKDNGRKPVAFHVNAIMESLGYLPFGTIIWNKKTTSNGASFGSYLSPSCPSFPTTFEFILIYAKEHLKLQSKGTTSIEKHSFLNITKSIWEVPPVSGYKGAHPCPFPVEIPFRLIKLLTWDTPTALVMDPFCGRGTTCYAAKMLNRNYLGIDKSLAYIQEAEDWIAHCPQLFINDFSKIVEQK